MTPAQTDLTRDTLALRQNTLAQAAAQLKTELLGIDDVIDRVIDAVRAWYVLPQLIQRPVIVCLWGLTGTGKTQLTRRLAQLLGFYDRFVEIQMDGFSNGASPRANTISSVLDDSSIRENSPGILVLDEFQRFRTMDAEGHDVKLERYPDVWTLLSDGRLPPALNALGTIERKLAEALYSAERDDKDGNDDHDRPKNYRFKLDVWDAQELRRMLKLQEPLADIMQWPPERVEQVLHGFQHSLQAWETDYSKLLIFVCGNLDEMYRETALRVQDCDTDADIFHQLTRQLSLIDVKKALGRRFRPEQIARLGNWHIVYPSFSKVTYQQLIAQLCGHLLDDIHQRCGIRLHLGAEVYHELYANAVFPTQGTRPLFSSVHGILSSVLIETSLWLLMNTAHDQHAGESVGYTLRLHPHKTHLQLYADAGDPPSNGSVALAQFAVRLELHRLKQRNNVHFRTLLAVHEAGHGLVYALLTGFTPQEIKINIASFEGGYNSFASPKASTRQHLLDMVCVSLAGRVAEEQVFGEMACTTGAEQDFKQATEQASRYTRYLGFDQRLSRSDVCTDVEEHLNTDVAPSNQAIETLLQAQYRRAHELLQQHRAAFLRLVEALMSQGMIDPHEMQTLMRPYGLELAASLPEHEQHLTPFADLLASFQAQ